jgi:hypothetical protein
VRQAAPCLGAVVTSRPRASSSEEDGAVAGHHLLRVFYVDVIDEPACGVALLPEPDSCRILADGFCPGCL